jgi:hypothetical protein
LQRIADGRLHLSGLCVLVPHLTADNHAELLEAASTLGKRQIEQLVAERFPKPDVPTSLHKQPSRSQPEADRQSKAAAAALPAPPLPTQPARAPARTERDGGSAARGNLAAASLPAAAPASAACVKPPVVHRQQHPQPLGKERYLLKVTVSSTLRDKLRRCQDLLAEQVPAADIATVLEQALDTLIAKQLKTKYAVGAKARRAPSTAEGTDAPGAQADTAAADTAAAGKDAPHERSRAIPAAIRRAVYQRDGGQCCYVDPKTGKRCPATRQLQFHHRLPFARGGRHSVDNVVLLCSCHNAHLARVDFGPAQIEAAIAARQADRASPSLPRGQLQRRAIAPSSG